MVYNLGIYEKGKYASHKNGKRAKNYLDWQSMLARAGQAGKCKPYPTYFDCSICEDWIHFQRFAEWHEENYYKVEGSKIQLDKDLLIQGNKIYSPETCVFAPSWLNTFIISSKISRGEHPLGVCFNKRNGKYKAQCSVNGAQKYLGYFTTPEEAHVRYVEFKRSLVPDILLRLKESLIPTEIYNKLEVALYTYDYSKG